MPEDETARSATLRDLFAALRTCVLERQTALEYQPVAGAPELLRRLGLPETSGALRPSLWSPFLESFLLEAEDFWSDGGDGLLKSGPWLEIGPDEREIHLEATALRVGERPVLLVQELGESYSERRDLLQKARENSLNYQRLFREIQMKEVLLHCIVHDLAGPLTGVKGLFSLLALEQLSEAGQRRLKIGEDAAQRLEGLINDILDVFSADVDALESFSVDPNTAPDLRRCATAVVDTLQPAATWRNITLELRVEDAAETIPVAGETTRLERVLFNLVENALRHSPAHGTVLISIRREDRLVRTEVLDEGSGVSPEEAPHLFKKFHQGSRTSGKAGLGLYFCRIMVERWGGQIGYENRPEGGACFCFSLPAVGLTDPPGGD